MGRPDSPADGAAESRERRSVGWPDRTAPAASQQRMSVSGQPSGRSRESRPAEAHLGVAGQDGAGSGAARDVRVRTHLRTEPTEPAGSGAARDVRTRARTSVRTVLRTGSRPGRGGAAVRTARLTREEHRQECPDKFRTAPRPAVFPDGTARSDPRGRTALRTACGERAPPRCPIRVRPSMRRAIGRPRCGVHPHSSGLHAFQLCCRRRCSHRPGSSLPRPLELNRSQNLRLQSSERSELTRARTEKRKKGNHAQKNVKHGCVCV